MTPLQYFDFLWERANCLKALHEFLDREVTAILEPDELLRSEWVARVSALDLYVHELIAQNMVAIFEGRASPSKAYLKYQMSLATQQRIQKANTVIDSSLAFDLEVRERHARLSFQDPEKIASGIRLISDTPLWNSVANAFGALPETNAQVSKDLKRELALIVSRRNRIAHEGDLQIGGVRKPQEIFREDVDQASETILKIVQAIDGVFHNR